MGGAMEGWSYDVGGAMMREEPWAGGVWCGRG